MLESWQLSLRTAAEDWRCGGTAPGEIFMFGLSDPPVQTPFQSLPLP